MWDVDLADLKLPVDPNVKTSRGHHAWTPYAGEAHQQKGVDHLDLLSNGNVVFWDDRGNKEVIRTSLSETEVLHAWWKEISGTSVRIDRPDRIGTHIDQVDRGKGRGKSTYAFCGLLLPNTFYLDQARARGFEVDLGFVAQGAEMSVAGATEGTRNRALFESSMRLIQCGIDPIYLVAAAEKAGLPTKEAEGVIRRAVSTYDPDRLPSVLDRAEAWLEAVTPVVHRRLHPMLGVIAKKAVEQNTTSPMIIQSDFPDLVGQPTISRRLAALNDRGILHRKDRGRHMGHLRPKYYQLCMRRTSRFRDDPCGCERRSQEQGHEQSTTSVPGQATVEAASVADSVKTWRPSSASYEATLGTGEQEGSAHSGLESGPNREPAGGPQHVQMPT